jgi:glycosyltransferase involved in cell wall biosynthesis
MSDRGVLMVTGAYWPEMSGGGLQCRTMIHALRDRFQFRVFTTCTDRSLPLVSEVEGTRVTRVHVDVSSPLTKLWAAVQTLRFFLAERRSFDIVHLHGFSQKSVLIVLLARLFGKRILLTIHTAGSDEAATVRQAGWLPYWAYRQADLYLAISSRIAHNYLAAGLPTAKLRLAPNGLDVQRFHPASRPEREAARKLWNLSDDLYWILFVGFFAEEKGPDVLFDAWLRLRERGGPPSGLLLVGETDSGFHQVDGAIARDIASRAAALGVSDRVRFTGPVAGVESAYHAADVFAMPSSREAFGMVIVEAMASGLPVIASRIDGVTDEIVEDGISGYLVEPRDPAALADALATVLANPAAASKLGTHARESVVSRFGLEAARQRWIETYEATSGL